MLSRLTWSVPLVPVWIGRIIARHPLDVFVVIAIPVGVVVEGFVVPVPFVVTILSAAAAVAHRIVQRHCTCSAYTKS